MSPKRTLANNEEENIMRYDKSCYIDGQWVTPRGDAATAVVNPATEEEIASVRLGSTVEVESAVAAAKKAFAGYSQTSINERLAVLDRVMAAYQRRAGDLARGLTAEMGAPIGLAETAQVPAGLGQLATTRAALAEFPWEYARDTTRIVHEPIGVCGLITPWNWPLLLIFAKIAPALAAGCTVVLKPSEVTPLNAILVAEILDEAEVPAGVVNMIQGHGDPIGAAIASHPDVDMVSFTGSTAAGIRVAESAAPTVKRVCQELGGKSANIVLEDADIAAVVARDLAGVFANSGQSCNASARILIPQSQLELAERTAAGAVAATRVGDPTSPITQVGPVASQAQYDKVQRMITTAIKDGARVVAGGPGRPEGLERGYFVRPTVISDVSSEMEIAQEEIFGPVVTLHPYQDTEDAIRIANDTRYGLSGMVSSSDPEKARDVARRIRTGMVHLNGAPLAMDSPFGGYRHSGNGREYHAEGLREFLETKSIFGYED
ncbi:aldehyde dehydrogenase family protein [Aeromicrobium sp. YIM 150415]|uniref:aldehyde dehydrogenase family protein n=1 Tax=Aeromicrobium sp. YIM 150415 TaxID=2803912 RepID=UPI0019625AB6|nr:aldehyde dehydrogenase family protein [Aeromicrobium sp. YIM 150415]MBM9462109.1 aldehyde dehydrogenase family protein [Aeromicrobium sp. YIM 150415]